jgi:hypothetical protein
MGTGWKLPVFIREEGSWEKWSGPIRGEGRGRSSGSQEGVKFVGTFLAHEEFRLPLLRGLSRRWT